MKKYNANPNDLALLTQYTQMMQEMVDMSEAFDKWGNEDLNNAELKYYIEVNNRVAQMLLEANTTP